MEQKNKIFSKGEFSPPLPDEYFRYLVVGLVKFLAKLRFVRPEHIVALGFVLKFMAVLAIFKEQLILSALLLFVGVLLDYVDGMLARATNRVSKLGGLLDLSSDFVSIVLIFFAIACYTGEYAFAVVSFVAMVLLVEIWSLLKAATISRLISEEFSYIGYLSKPLVKNDNWLMGLLNKFYMVSWVPFLKNAQLIYSEDKRLRKGKALYFFSIASVGLNQSLLCICLLANALEFYLYFNIALLPIYVILLYLLSGNSSEKPHPPH